MFIPFSILGIYSIRFPWYRFSTLIFRNVPKFNTLIIGSVQRYNTPFQQNFRAEKQEKIHVYYYYILCVYTWLEASVAKRLSSLEMDSTCRVQILIETVCISIHHIPLINELTFSLTCFTAFQGNLSKSEVFCWGNLYHFGKQFSKSMVCSKIAFTTTNKLLKSAA